MHRVAHTFSCTLLSEKKESLPDKAYFYFAFASNMSKIARISYHGLRADGPEDLSMVCILCGE